MSRMTRSQKGKAAATVAPPANAMAQPTSISNPSNGTAARQSASRQPLQPIDTNIAANTMPTTAACDAPLASPAVATSSSSPPAATALTVAPAPALLATTTVSSPVLATNSAPIQGNNSSIDTPPGTTTTQEQHQESANDAVVVSQAPLVSGSGNGAEPLSLEEEVQRLRALIRAQQEALAANSPPPPPPAAPAVQPENENAPIPRPRPLPTNPQTALGLQHDHSLYLRCRRVVRSCINKVEESYLVNWHDQPDEFIAKVKSLAKSKCPHLGRYRNGWATELLMCGSNKNKRRYDRVLERDPNGEKRKAMAAARAAQTAASHASGNSSTADDERSTSEDVTMQSAQPEASPSNSNNGIDNLSELTEEERNEMLNDPLANEDEDFSLSVEYLVFEETFSRRTGQKLLTHDLTRCPLGRDKIWHQGPDIQCQGLTAPAYGPISALVFALRVIFVILK
ncbi:hypothetical protein BJ165DRAFT_1408567 [Panaeolus papilionaceus]|nr:hypothetical protein BJ165DRAFT_1408567 [Panaeolus papilionaceus]